MTQSPGQFEIQLGHLCNNRCVFCVSGQLTSRGEAPLLRGEDLCQALDRAWASGYRRVTLLGGEPTIQPYFMDVVRHAVGLGFEIVLFSNGSKPGRTALVDEVAATGGRFEWRFSFQGATREAHERTTRRKGSFAQLLRAVDRARGHGHCITVNMCVVRQNYESVDSFPALLVPRDVAQLHLDMVNPYDTGTLSEEGITGILPRYTDLVPPLERMVAGFPEGFDVNIGNLPYCVAPQLARFIHHGGERTWTVTANDHGAGELGEGRKKYVLKQAFKSKPERCGKCVFDDRCSGVFDAYAERFGLEELQPVSPERLAELDPDGHFFSLRVGKVLRGVLRKAALPKPFSRMRAAEVGPGELELAFSGAAGGLATGTLEAGSVATGSLTTGSPGPELILSIVPPREGAFSTNVFAARIKSAAAAPEAVLAALRWLWEAALGAGMLPVHPPGADAVRPLPRAVAARLGRARGAAPFGSLVWQRVEAIPGGIELVFASPAGERVVAWLTEAGGKVRSGYRVEASSQPPSEELIRGARRLLVALGRLPEAALAEGYAPR